MAEEKKEEIAVIEITEEYMKERIYEIRGQRVILDSDLSEIYGYTTKAFNQQVKNNIEKTDYIFCPSALLFSKRFVEKIGNLLREEMKFFSCRLVCQDVSLEWYAAKIILRIPIIDKEASTYRTLSDGERVLNFIKFRRDIEEEFFIAKDKESITNFVVSELFVDICKRNGLLIDFKEV